MCAGTQIYTFYLYIFRVQIYTYVYIYIYIYIYICFKVQIIGPHKIHKSTLTEKKSSFPKWFVLILTYT